MAGQKPVAKFVAGQVSAAIWENEISVNGRQVTALKATIQRRYKDGTWKSSQSFSCPYGCVDNSVQAMSADTPVKGATDRGE